MPSDLDFRAVPVGDGDGAALVTAMIEEMRQPYWDVGGPGSGGVDLNSADMPKAGPAERGPPGRGYVAIGNFNADPVATFFGEKQL